MSPTGEKTKESSRQKKAMGIVVQHVYYSMGAGLIPVPIFDIAAVGTIQFLMVRSVAELYGEDVSENLTRPLISSAVGGTLPAAVAASLGRTSLASFIKAVPIVGPLIAAGTVPVLSGASTYAVGKAFVQHFESGGTLLTIDPSDFKDAVVDAFEEGKQTAQAVRKAASADAAASQAAKATSSYAVAGSKPKPKPKPRATAKKPVAKRTRTTTKRTASKPASGEKPASSEKPASGE